MLNPLNENCFRDHRQLRRIARAALVFFAAVTWLSVFGGEGRAAGAHMRAGEIYLGTVADESGVSFFLLRDQARSHVFYVLDEDRLAEALLAHPVSAQIRIGAHTGFAYYRDRYLPRWILVGVRKADAEDDGIFDGPFDQLPLVGSKQKPDAPSARNTGIRTPPYLLYSKPDQLAIYDQCAAIAPGPAEYYRCFAPWPHR